MTVGSCVEKLEGLSFPIISPHNILTLAKVVQSF